MSRVLDIVVVIILFPLGEKNALLTLLPAFWVATGLGILVDVFSFLTSQSFTVVSSPAVAMVKPLG
jgi:hypothetical protein